MLGSSLISTLDDDKYVEHFNRRQLKQSLDSEFDISSGSLITRNISYRTSSTLTRQQNLEIGVDYVNLSSIALKILNGKYTRCLGIRVCWHLMNFESSTPIIQVQRHLVKIKDLQKYTITLNDVFLNYISKQRIHFDLYGVYEHKEKHLGRSELELTNFLQCIEKEISQQLEIISASKFKFFKKCQHNNEKMGILGITYCLKPLSLTELPRVLDKIELEELYYKLHQTPSSELLNNDQSIFYFEGMQSPTTIHDAKAKKLGVSVSNYNFIRNILDDVLNGDEFATEKECYITDQKKKSNYNKSLEEYAILSGTNPKNARIYEKDDIKVRNYDKRQTYESAVIINVISLQLNEKKYPLKKNEVREFYIEYSFLSRTGREMETLSLPLLEKRVIEYNFKRTFLIDSESHYSDCKILAKMVRDKKSIKFIIVEEPVEDVSRFQICREVGFAEINLFDLIQTEENAVTDFYPILDILTPSNIIGNLKVCFWGVQAIRTAALKVLEPYVLRKPGRIPTV